MRCLTLIILLTISYAGCKYPKYFKNTYDPVSNSLLKESKRCRNNSIYAVGVDTFNSTAIHFALCSDGNRFNASLPPTVGKEGLSKFYSGNYETSNDTIKLTFDKEHIPEFLSNRIAYSVDKRSLVWISKNDKSIKLSIMRPGMNIKDR